MTESEQKGLAAYLAAYLEEEARRGNIGGDDLQKPEIVDFLLWNGISAWIGGAR